MSGLHEQVETPAPPDDWLALSKVERAELEWRAANLDLTPPANTASAAVLATSERGPEGHVVACEPASLPTPDDIGRLAERLAPDERAQLVRRLWLSLPLKDRAAMVTLGLEDLQQSANDAFERASPRDERVASTAAWRFLFDPTGTSALFSAPRRFDLATIFVAMAAYSILFGGLTALDATFDFGPLPIVLFGSVIAIVAAAQALWHGVANPRGVSVVAGAAAYTLFFLILFSMHPRAFGNSFIAGVVINGLMVGPFVGYLVGVLVGGVFLVADAMRRRFTAGEEPAE